MKILNYYFLIFLALLPLGLSAQKLTDANRWFEKGAYYKSVQEYKNLLATALTNQEEDEVIYRLGLSYLKMADFENAKTWLEKASLRDNVEKGVYFYLGDVYLITGEYVKAKEAFKRHSWLVPDDERTENRLASCDYALTAAATDPNVKVSPLIALNTRGSEYGILFVNGGLIYSSTGDEIPTNPRNISLRTGMGFSKPYLSHFDNGTYQQGILLTSMSKNRTNEGSFAYDMESEQLYYTRCAENSVRCEIIRAKLTDYSYKEIGTLKIGNGKYNIAHTYVTNSGNRIYFSSNKDGGQGGADIWYIDKQPDGKFSEPVNVGPEVNTPGNEVFPYIWGGKLFFASDGHVGYGGLDVFMSTLNEGVWRKPVNMGPGINTSYDDFNLIMNRDGRGGLFVSNRTPDHSDDIFSFDVDAIVIEFSGTVKDLSTENIIPAVMVEISTDDFTKEVEMDDEGSFNILLNDGVKYRLRLQAEGYHTVVEEIVAKAVMLNTFDREQNHLQKVYLMEPIVEQVGSEKPKEIRITETKSTAPEPELELKPTPAPESAPVPDKTKSQITSSPIVKPEPPKPVDVVPVSQEQELKDLLSKARLPYNMEAKVGNIQEKGWWIQVAMLMQSKVISYEFAFRIRELTGKEVVMRRDSDGGHHFYIGAYAEETEARKVVGILKADGIDCFIKKVE
ncbi:MAG: hypothetical protein LBM07_03265 [Culturomica sp.]|nr:hypothetical protein [Culturomica sp.]